MTTNNHPANGPVSLDRLLRLHIKADQQQEDK